MAGTIRWSPDEINQDISKLTKLSQEMSTAKTVVEQVRVGLQWKVKSAADIDTSLVRVTKDLQSQMDKLAAMTTVCRMAAEMADTKNNLLRQHLELLHYSVDPTQSLGGIEKSIDTSVIPAFWGVTATGGSIAGAVLGNLTDSGQTEVFDPAFLLDYVEGIKEVGSPFKDLNDITDMIGEFSDSELNSILNEMSGDIKKLPIFKVAGYITDFKDFGEAVFTGNLEKAKELTEKYSKKGIKAINGIKGFGEGVLLDVGWNMIENFGESVYQMTKEPSLGNLACGVWSITGGAIVETGVELAEDTLDAIYGLLGKDFDKQDFRNAMDFLGGAVKDSIQYWSDGVVEAGVGVANAVADAASAAWDGLTKLGESAASWITSWF